MALPEEKEGVELSAGSPAAPLTVSPSPHIKNPVTTERLMRDVLIALSPALFWGVWVFGVNALLMPLISVVACVFFEYITEKILRRPVTVCDLSAVVTGLLLGFNLPANNSYFLPVLGAAFAIIVVKQLFGGLGKNFVNPALAARVFLFLSFPTQMTRFPVPFSRSAEIVAGATPRAGGAAGLFDLFFGRTGGCIGEVSAFLLLLGGVYLLCRRVITYQIPVSYLLTVAVLTLLFPSDGTFLSVQFMLRELFSGGLMLGAIFMATDYVTSPVTSRGRLVFGVGCGLLTVFFRSFGSYPEGVSFAILVMNCLVYYIDKLTMPRVFGGARHAKK